ncbi:MAG: polyribonucleotide nucleotidyltransferase [Pseudomonadota bacterium]|nr:polyribonucleotide nucleotidyltransferase [Pseudomonadota bacterium]MED5339323.1 polyribonucleotide nucleotidyltransferase [Pseudomonadota bacterium]
MFEIVKKEIDWVGKKLTLETGKIARQADGAVLATLGETSVLCTVVGAKEASPELDFFPLSVHYTEKNYAAGKIPGGFFKREGRPSEHENLVSRLIDRPIRPLFHSSYKSETQVLCNVVSHDLENSSDVVALIGASAALTISGLPFLGPIAGGRVGSIDGKFVLNPTIEEMKNSDLDLMVAGTDAGILMVESEANELSEEKMLEAVMFGHAQSKPVIEMIVNLAEECAKDPVELSPEPDNLEKLEKEIASMSVKDLEKAYQEKNKKSRHEKIEEIKKRVLEKLTKEDDSQVSLVNDLLKKMEKKIVRSMILTKGARIDGRDTSSIRPIQCDVGIFPRVHGSALFTRGETQAIVVTTLGTGQDEQIIDGLAEEYRENFMLHYNFPPYSVGEVGRVGFTGRREVGHGKLAWRSIHPLMPKGDDCPYTVRVVSEITESNGSSSMATVCGASMSLMDAGIPLKKPVAGIAMGLIKEEKKHAILSDILGDEDHLGDMDFKVAGTKDGITALQMDIKITGITEEIMKESLSQAKEGRIKILGEMSKAIKECREKVRDYAPKIETFEVPKEKIREIIGTGGKVIRELCETTNTKIDIDEQGIVKCAGTDSKSVDQAVKMIKNIIEDPEVGKIYDGKVVKCVEFGAFVNLLGKKDGLVHISELTDGHVKQTTDVVNEGDAVKVKVLDIDRSGKIKLTMKKIDQAVKK